MGRRGGDGGRIRLCLAMAGVGDGQRGDSGAGPSRWPPCFYLQTNLSEAAVWHALLASYCQAVNFMYPHIGALPLPSDRVLQRRRW